MHTDKNKKRTSGQCNYIYHQCRFPLIIFDVPDADDGIIKLNNIQLGKSKMFIECVVLVKGDKGLYHFSHDRNIVMTEGAAVTMVNNMTHQHYTIPLMGADGKKSYANIIGFQRDTAGNIVMTLETENDTIMKPIIVSMVNHAKQRREKAMQENAEKETSLDVNKDGVVNIFDATFILSALKEFAGEDGRIDINDVEELHIKQTEEFRRLLDALKLCDVDDSGTIDMSDVEAVLHELYGIKGESQTKIPTKKRHVAVGSAASGGSMTDEEADAAAEAEHTDYQLNADAEKKRTGSAEGDGAKENISEENVDLDEPPTQSAQEDSAVDASQDDAENKADVAGDADAAKT